MFGHSYTMSDAFAPFNRNVVRAHRDRAARGIENYDFLYLETAERLCDRLSDITRTFPTALDLGWHGGEVGQCLGDRGGAKFFESLQSGLCTMVTSFNLSGNQLADQAVIAQKMGSVFTPLQ